MRILAFFLSFVLGVQASAETMYQVFLLNVQNRFETGEDLNLVQRSARQIAVGATRDGHGLLLEASSFESTSGGALGFIRREHQEVSLWLRTDLGGWSAFRWLGGASAGFLQEKVTTRVDELQTIDVGHRELLGGLSLGGVFSLDLNPARPKKEALQVSLEGRLFFASNFDPNPQPDVVLRSGFSF